MSSSSSQENLDETISRYSLSPSKPNNNGEEYIRPENDYLYGCGIVGALNVEEKESDARIQQTNSPPQRISFAEYINPYVGSNVHGPGKTYLFARTNSSDEYTNDALEQIINGNPNNITYQHFDEVTDGKFFL
uniref:Uncharacterized protein n=1 Tax=Panagrolaimus sp. ES5 TaxID=591445 RepID=A0AC34FI57_9BILA